jgi:hypothetical protein
MRMLTRRCVGRAVAVALAVGLSACGGDDADEADTAEPTTATTDAGSSTQGESAGATTTAALSPEDEVVRDYEAASAAFSAAANPPNPDAPSWPRTSPVRRWRGTRTLCAHSRLPVSRPTTRSSTGW